MAGAVSATSIAENIFIIGLAPWECALGGGDALVVAVRNSKFRTKYVIILQDSSPY